MNTILIVDDEFSIVETLSEILTWEGYEVSSAAHGVEGLARIRDRMPALVLLDYMMPHMDGLRVLHALRADPLTAELAVVLMTAAPMHVIPERDRLWNEVLRKPFEIDALLTVVRRFAAPARK